MEARFKAWHWLMVIFVLAAVAVVTVIFSHRAGHSNALIDGAGIFLALLAVVFAAIQYFHSRHLINSIQTRYVGAFPGCVAEIADVVECAKHRLDIMVDHCGYGCFSNREEFERYFLKIQERAFQTQHVVVRMIVYDAALQRRSMENQFRPDWKNIRNREEFHECFSKGTPPTKFEEFIEALAVEEQNYRQSLETAGARIQVNSREELCFLWIADEEAAFSFRSKDEGGDRELAFRTKDHALIETFSKVFEKTWARTKLAGSPSF